MFSLLSFTSQLKEKINIPLSIICLLALIVRIWGISPGFHPFHPDEPQVYSRAWLILQGKEESFGYIGYPALVPLLHAFIYAIFFFPLQFLFEIIKHSSIFDIHNLKSFIDSNVVGGRDINILYWGRYTTATLGTLSVFALYQVGKLYFDKKTALIAAILLAFNYELVLTSHFALVDIPNGFFFIIAYYFIYQVLKEPSYKNFLYIGVAIALSMSVKLSPFMGISALLAILFNNRMNFILIKKLLICLIVFIIVFVGINYYHIIHYKEAINEINILSLRYAGGNFKLLPFPYFYLFEHGLGPLLTIFLFIGIAFSFFKKTKELIILIIPVVCLFFSLTYYSIGGVYVRNFDAVLPVLLLLSAYGLNSFTLVFIKNKSLYILTIVLICFLSLKESLHSIQILDFNYSKPWNYITAKDELKSGLNGTIAINNWTASLILPSNIKRVEYQLDSLLSVRELQEEQISYAIPDLDFTQSAFTWWMSGTNRRAFISKPEDLLYETYPGGALKELLAYRTKDFIKPKEAPEYNMFLVPIPEYNLSWKGTIVYSEGFDTPIDWVIKGTFGKPIYGLEQIFDQKCKSRGCIQIQSYQKGELQDSLIDGPSAFRFVRLTSQPIQVQSNRKYRISVDLWSDRDIEKNKRSGFFKVELFKDIETASSEKAGELIYVSSRIYGKADERQTKDITFEVPNDYNFMTISFQMDRNNKSTTYFDNLVVEESSDVVKPTQLKEFPEDLIFINEIL